MAVRKKALIVFQAGPLQRAASSACFAMDTTLLGQYPDAKTALPESLDIIIVDYRVTVEFVERVIACGAILVYYAADFPDSAVWTRLCAPELANRFFHCSNRLEIGKAIESVLHPVVAT